MDHQKAFDSIEFTALFKALENQRVDQAYITILSDLCNGATSVLKLHRDSDKIKLEGGARQDDNISPKIFTACLQDAIIKRIDWEAGTHLIFTDDIILFAKSPEELTCMLTDIHNTSKPAGLDIHLGKTKVMFNEHAKKCTLTVNGENIKEVDSFVYLGKTVTKDGDLLPEIGKRIALGWAALVKWITF